METKLITELFDRFEIRITQDIKEVRQDIKELRKDVVPVKIKLEAHIKLQEETNRKYSKFLFLVATFTLGIIATVLSGKLL